MPDVRIADFEVGRPAEGVYAVVRKQRRHSKSGDAYLVLELSDSSGRIEGRIWRNADWFDRNVHEGDRVRAVGSASTYRDELQFEIRRLDRVDGAADEPYIPAASRDLDDLVGELDFLAAELQHPALSALVGAVWNGEHRQRLTRSPATSADHHAYLGGLVEHTVSVASICLAAVERHERIDRELLLAAALLHDVGRARELRVEDAVRIDEAGRLYGHLLLGHELILEAAVGAARTAPGSLTTLASEAWWPALVHAVQLHHAPPDRCRTREALTLNTANTLDVRLAMRER